jgi:hypothetical protein
MHACSSLPSKTGNNSGLSRLSNRICPFGCGALVNMDLLCSFAYIDAYSNNFYIAGTRTLGGNANTILLVGPAFNGEWKECWSWFGVIKPVGRREAAVVCLQDATRNLSFFPQTFVNFGFADGGSNPEIQELGS